MAIKFAAKDDKPAPKAAEAKAARVTAESVQPAKPAAESPAPSTAAPSTAATDLFNSEPKPAGRKRKAK